MIGVLAPLLNPDRQTDPAHLVGSEVAGRDFVKNMVIHLKAPVGLIVPDSSAGSEQQELSRVAENQSIQSNIRSVVAVYNLPALLRAGALIALHNVGGAKLDVMSYLRSQFAPRLFPLTCLVHGFSYQYALWDTFSRLAFTPTAECDAIVCTSVAARQAFSNLLAQTREGLVATGASPPDFRLRLETIPLGVDTDLYRPRDKQDARYLLGLPQDKVLILYFGRIDPTGKCDLTPLLSIFQQILRQHKGVTLVLAGAGTDQAATTVRRIINATGCSAHTIVRFSPTMIEGPLYYAASDIFVSTSDTLQESFGLTVVEAMASGLPVVVSDWSGYRDTVIHGQTGYRVRSNWMKCDTEIDLFSPLQPWDSDHFHLSQSVAVDTEELHHYLDLLVTHREQRTVMGQAARQHVLANLAWNVIMERYYALWLELSEIAGNSNFALRRKQALVRADYFSNFHHFATHCLDGNEIIEVTEAGRSLARNAERLLVYREIQPNLNPKLLRVAVRYIRIASVAHYELALSEVISLITKKFRTSQENAAIHMMWLMKRGLVRIRPSK